MLNTCHGNLDFDESLGLKKNTLKLDVNKLTAVELRMHGATGSGFKILVFHD